MRIYVGGFSYSASIDSLRSLFETRGAVSDVSIVTDRLTNESRGFGFVDMPDDAEAQSAISHLNGYELEGRSLLVNVARAREERHGGRW